MTISTPAPIQLSHNDYAGASERHRLALSPDLAERYGAARQCIHCKIAAADRPGMVCRSAHGPVRCSETAPLYAKALGAYVRELRCAPAACEASR